MFNQLWNRVKENTKRFLSSRFVVLILVFCVLFSILVGRLFYLQIVKGDYYLNNYELQIRKTRTIPGTRGNIYDRNGKLLAYNDLAYSVTFEDNITGQDRNKKINKIMEQIIEIVESHGDSVINSFGIVLDSAGNYQFTQTNETLLLRFIADVYGEIYVDNLTKEQKQSTPDDLIEYLCTDEVYGYGIDMKKNDKDHILKLVNMRYAINLNSFQKYIPTVLASDISDETAAAIMENLDKLEGVDITEESLRRYEDSKAFASIIGYTGQISQEEYDTLDKEQKKKYSKSDVVGKSGLEQTLDSVLQGEKGEMTFYTDTVGKIIDTVSYKEQGAGNDVYLTIDKDLQVSTYHIIEEKLAGILLSKMRNVMNYDPGQTSDSKEIIIPVDDAYNAFIANEIIDEVHFGTTDAGPVEKQVYDIFTARKESAIAEILAEMSGTTPYNQLSAEMKAYQDYISITVLQESTGLLMSNEIDTSDEMYIKWAKDETISLNEFLNYAISKNWVNTSLLNEQISTGKYSDASEVYSAILKYLQEYLNNDIRFDKLLYKYLIKTGAVKGTQICAITYEQGVLPMEEDLYNGLSAGSVDSYEWLRSKIKNLEITPGQLALEPCTGSAVVSDPNTGEVLACVSYPGYDNNRLSNTMDSDYYNQLVTGLSRPFYNNATQEKTAPGSTFKMVSATAALTEGLVQGDTTLYCGGEFTQVTPSPKCWAYPNGHGHINVVTALDVSCNNYFYDVGYQFGLDEDKNYDSDKGVAVLKKYAEMFGFNETSGIEIPESEPEISDKYAVETAIGQGTANYTVSQLNRYVSAVANKGTLHKLTLLSKTTDPNGQVIKNYEPVVTDTIEEVSDETWNLLHQGMTAMIEHTPGFHNIGIPVAGKTGTAQQSRLHPDHGLFVGFAPVEDPEIAISVRIKNGYTSAYAAEIGRDIIRANYYPDQIDKIVTGSAAELGSAISD